jgi:PAS domain S-box-containing protein
MKPVNPGVTDAMLAGILHNSPVAIAVHDADDRIVYVNPWFLQLYGYEPDEILGRSHADLFLPEARGDERERLYSSIRSFGFWRGEDLRVRKDGTTFPRPRASPSSATPRATRWLGPTCRATSRAASACRRS